MIVSGGEISYETCEQYDVLTGDSQELPELNQGRRVHSSCTFSQTTIYIFCGRNESNQELNTIEKYDLL